MTTKQRKQYGVDVDMPVLDDSDVIIFDPDDSYNDYDEEDDE